MLVNIFSLSAPGLFAVKVRLLRLNYNTFTVYRLLQMYLNESLCERWRFEFLFEWKGNGQDAC